jgi:serine/threonine protein kinase
VKIIDMAKYPRKYIIKEFDLQYKFRDVAVQPYPYPTAQDDKYFGVSMEFMKGTLNDLLKEQGGHFDAVDAARAMWEVAHLVERLHNGSDPVVHGDLKPANILYKMKGGKRVFRLGDFGCARNEDATVTHAAGTTDYCLNLQEHTSHRDIYALGIIMMELQGVRMKEFNERYQPETLWEYTDLPVDVDLRAISRKCCNIRLEDRYTIAGFLEALDGWMKKHQDEIFLKDNNADTILRKARNLEQEWNEDRTPEQLKRLRLFYNAAAEKGSGEASYGLYRLFMEDENCPEEMKRKQLENSSRLEFAPAMNEYACNRLRELGTDCQPELMQSTAELFRKAAEQYPAAAYNLALLIKAGLVQEDTPEQVEMLLTQAMNSGYEPAARLFHALHGADADQTDMIKA